jgi:hypothetical protein
VILTVDTTRNGEITLICDETTIPAGRRNGFLVCYHPFSLESPASPVQIRYRAFARKPGLIDRPLLFLPLPFFPGVSMNWLVKVFLILGSVVSLLIAINAGRWL